MTSHIHDITKSLATPLCGATGGTCVDAESAYCVDCHKAQVAVREAETHVDGLEGLRAYHAYIRLDQAIDGLLKAFAYELMEGRR